MTMYLRTEIQSFIDLLERKYLRPLENVLSSVLYLEVLDVVSETKFPLRRFAPRYDRNIHAKSFPGAG